MKFLKWLLIVVASLFGLFILVSYFLPKDYYVERSLEIASPAVLVYSQVVDLEAWQEWEPWGKLDPEMTVTYGDIRSGPGASYVWESEMSGNGAMEVIKADPSKEVRYKLVFAGYEENPSYSSIMLDAADVAGPTTVTWTFEGSVGDKLFARWMVLLMDKFVGMNYETGLASLKERCEGMVTLAGSPAEPGS